MDYIKVGTINKPFGLKGELKVYTDSDFIDERFQKGAVLWGDFKGQMKQVTISSMRLQMGRPIITVDNKFDINLVTEYLGVDLYIKPSDLKALQEDEFYIFELIDKMVYNVDGEEIGKVTDVLDLPAHPVLEVQTKDNKKILIPFVNAFVKEIQEERIIIEEIEGLR